MYVFDRVVMVCCTFFFQAEDGIRYLVRSRGLGDVYKRQVLGCDLGEHGDISLIGMEGILAIAGAKGRFKPSILSLIHI